MDSRPTGRLIYIWSKTMKIFIDFSRPTHSSIFSLAIRTFLRTEYSHASIRLNLLTIPMVGEASKAEVGMSQYESWEKGHKVLSTFEVEVTQEEFQKILFRLFSVLRKPYSIASIFMIVSRSVFKMKASTVDGNRKFICSELIAFLLSEIIGIPSSDFLTPKDLYKHLEVCSGRIKKIR